MNRKRTIKIMCDSYKCIRSCHYDKKNLYAGYYARHYENLNTTFLIDMYAGDGRSFYFKYIEAYLRLCMKAA